MNSADKRVIDALEPALSEAVNSAINNKAEDPVKYLIYYLQNRKPMPAAPASAAMKQLDLKVPCPALGVIRLDYNYPPAPGDVDSEDTYNYDVHYRAVPGLTFEMCQSGKMTPEVEKRWLEAIHYLEDKKVSVLTGDCGFMMYFQGLTRRNTKLPVCMSSLAQLPAVTCSYAASELIAIFTANGKTLSPMRDLIRDECGVDTQNQRFLIVGCEDVPGFEAVAAGDKVDVAKVTPGMIEKAKKVLREHPRVRAFLFECTELPPYSDAVRAATGLPVYDSITACNFFMSGVQDNERFGLNEWQVKWDQQQQKYELGQNLTAAERAEMKTL